MEDVGVDADVEIEVVNPESVTLDDGSMEITLIPDAEVSDFMAST